MQYNLYVRQIVDLIGLLSQVGGLKGFVMMIGATLVEYWVSKQYMSSIVYKIF